MRTDSDLRPNQKRLRACEGMEQTPLPRRFSIALINWALAGVFALFAYAHVQAFRETPRLSVLLIVGMEALLVLFVLVRRDPSRTWHSWQTWLTTCGGTVFPMLLRPAEMQSDLLIGQAVQLIGVFDDDGRLVT